MDSLFDSHGNGRIAEYYGVLAEENALPWGEGARHDAPLRLEAKSVGFYSCGGWLKGELLLRAN